MSLSAASAAPTTDTQTLSTKVTHDTTLYEEEISDVSLGTFYVFDKEKVGTSGRGLKFAQGGCSSISDDFNRMLIDAGLITNL